MERIDDAPDRAEKTMNGVTAAVMASQGTLRSRA